MPQRSPMRFYFDVISPYAYLGWTQVRALAETIGRELEPVPVLFAAMLNAHGNKGPAEIPPKRLYLFKHIVRTADELGVPLQPPPTHPFNPLLALRLASVTLPPAERISLVNVLMDRTWGTGVGVADPASLAPALTEAGFDGAGLVAKAAQPEAKAALRQHTEDAIARGVFGVPSYDVDGELFWGQDAHGHIRAFAAGDDPVDRQALERWRVLPASARR